MLTHTEETVLNQPSPSVAFFYEWLDPPQPTTISGKSLLRLAPQLDQTGEKPRSGSILEVSS